MSSSAIRAGRAFVELFVDNSQLIRGLRQAEASVVKFGNKIKNIGKGMMGLGAMASAPFMLAVKVFSDFDDEMRAVKAVTGATGREFDALTEKAKLLGRTTSFTAAQVASGMLELGRAGFKTDEIDAAIPAVLDLARATGTDLAMSAEIAANTLRQFELPATEMGRVCDVMVAAANNSAQTLEDLGESMNYCAPIASEYGMSLEQSAKALGALANFGIKASAAGTALRRILTNLADPKIQQKLHQLGVSVVDVKTGKLRDVSAVLRDLGDATKGMAKDQKLGLFKEFFGMYAIAGGAKLTAAEFDNLNDAIDTAAGTANRTAKEMDGGIGGSLRMLWSAIEGINIAIGEALAPSMKKMIDYFTAACTGIAEYITNHKELIVTVFQTIRKFTMLGGAVLAAGLGFIVAGKMIGIVASSIAGVAKAALFGLSMIEVAAKVVTFAFTGLSGALVSMVSIFSGIVSAVSITFGLIASGVSIAFGVIATIGGATFSVLAAAIGLLATPVGLVVVSLAALAAACIFVQRNASTIGEVFSAAFARIGAMVRSATASVSKFLTDVYVYLNQFYDMKALFWIIGLVTSGVKIFASVVQGAFRMAVSVVSTFVQAFFGVVSAIFSVKTAVVTMLTGAFSAVFRVVRDFSAKCSSIIVYGISGGFSKFAGLISGGMGGVSNIVVTAFTSIVSVVSSMLSKLTGVTIKFSLPITDFFQGIASRIAGCFSPIFGVMESVLGRVVGFLRKFFVFEAVIQIVYHLGKAFYGIGSAVYGFVTSCRSAASETPGMFSKLVQWFQSVPKKISGAFGSVGSVITNVVTGISSRISGVFSDVVSSISGVFASIGGVISNFGNGFLLAFAGIGTMVEWFKMQLGTLVNFARETFGAITTAIGNGDIEAALQVVWASLKLIWVKGSTSLVSTWYWVIETLQSAWAKCVFSISEILTKAWFGVQEFWTETVYTMLTVWTIFSSNIVTAWKTAEKAIAKGIGYLIAKMEGLDPDEMAKTIEDDYNRQTKQREAEKGKQLTQIQTNRDTKMASLKDEKQGTLDNLKGNFDRDAANRKSGYDTKLAAQEQELAAARAAYNEAINRAKNPPAPKNEEAQPKTAFAKVEEQLRGVMKGFQANPDLESKVSVTGSFSAAAISAMGAGSVMDRVAKATEKSEKHLAKIADKDAKTNVTPSKKKEIHADPDIEDDLAIKEMKNQTQILRDISTKGGVFV